MEDNSRGRSQKRRRLSNEEEVQTDHKKLIHGSLMQPVSPPPLRRAQPVVSKSSKIMQSPFELTTIKDLPATSNVETVCLKDILGDPLIAECWEFNYLHDLDFLMAAFDEDVRDMVKVHVVHGFWKNEDASRLKLKAQAAKYSNITLHTAFMPEMFGTHHSKMLIIFRRDDTAQVIIHTANMIPFDWGNMTQAMWRSPLLPLVKKDSTPPQSERPGSGSKFKTDMLNYLKAYDGKRTICKPLVARLSKYDFSEVRAALIASVPGKQHLDDAEETFWGWPGLKNVLRAVSVQKGEPEIVIQISSIASLGGTDMWLNQTLFKAMRTSKAPSPPQATFRIVFPTADEVRRSLNGYESGNAIHTKIQTPAQIKQLQYLRPFLCHWAGDGAQHQSQPSTPISDAGRKRAAPHIKTFIRFADSNKTSIDWMLVTSANLSKQAWGGVTNAAGDVRIASYEIGVMVWPELLGKKAVMVPTFKTDMPAPSNVDGELVVGTRMPYDLPLVPYAEADEPWCATSSYNETDWKGVTWNVG